jgi:cellulose synthase/poly-beta-1,6-N-acetylglucosamine synthase-like glycosyltransferase
VERAVAGAAQLDWPRDKLHVQVCDDSTDGTTELARAAAERANAAGVDVAVIRRADRSEFKAGNLRNAMAHTRHDYFAIFDVDYVAPPDFLRRCMAALLADPGLAFVQARIDYLNPGESALTRAQAIQLDQHSGLEQATRSWAGQPVPFNGTCGVWRRAAIEQAGGWRGDTLSEDWDLSYRAWAKGWRSAFLVTVTAAGELPAGFGAWASQQRRWAAGAGEVGRRMLPAARQAFGRSLGEAAGALLPFATWLAHAMFAATLIVAAAAMLLRPASAVALGVAVYVVLAAAILALFAAVVVVDRTLARNTPVARLLLDFPMVLLLQLYTSWAILCSLPGTLFGRERVFVRTPKRGSSLDRP